MTIEKQPGAAPESNRQPADGNRPGIEVSAALIFQDGKLLITQRRRQDHLGGLWEFPGGKREPGETFEQCLVREIREELGVEISVGDLFEAVAHDYPDKSVHLKFYRCRLLSGDPRPIECAAVRWVNPDELRQFAFPAADARLLEKLRTTAEMWP